MIFAKTNRGRIAAFDPQSTLPAPQKALRKLIDGKTPLTKINRACDPSACSFELIVALMDQELVQVVKAPLGVFDVSANDDGKQAARLRHLSLVPTDDEDAVTASLAALLEPARRSDFVDSAGHSANYQDRLQAAKDSLISFVLAHLPQEANAVLQEVSQIAHNDQLKATIIAVLSMADQASRTDPSKTRALNQALLQLTDE